MDEVAVSIATLFSTQSFSAGSGAPVRNGSETVLNNAKFMENRFLMMNSEMKAPQFRVNLRITAISVALLFSSPAESQVPATAPPLTYADVADLALPAPVVAHVRSLRAVPLKRAQAAAPPGQTRFFVEAEVISLIKGPGGLPARVTYLADVPNDEKGRAAKLPKKGEYLVFASSVAGRPGELQLTAPDAHAAFTPALAERTRRLLGESSRPEAAPRISGIGRAFHVPGSLPGESETQIFLLAGDGRPVSLSILRRPGEQPRWAVALSEIVDDAAGPPQRETLLWYRLACSLPAGIPAQSMADADVVGRTGIQADYRLVKEALGPCLRVRKRSG